MKYYLPLGSGLLVPGLTVGEKIHKQVKKWNIFVKKNVDNVFVSNESRLRSTLEEGFLLRL